jgi:hypothetical protein
MAWPGRRGRSGPASTKDSLEPASRRKSGLMQGPSSSRLVPEQTYTYLIGFLACVHAQWHICEQAALAEFVSVAGLVAVASVWWCFANRYPWLCEVVYNTGSFQF